MSNAPKGPVRITKKQLIAVGDLAARNVEPLDMMLDVYKKSMEAYDRMRGYNDKSDAGPGYLGIAAGIAKTLAGYRYPTLKAIAVAEVGNLEKETAKPINIKEALIQLAEDPFADKETKELARALKMGESLPGNVIEMDTVLPIGNVEKSVEPVDK